MNAAFGYAAGPPLAARHEREGRRHDERHGASAGPTFVPHCHIKSYCGPKFPLTGLPTAGLVAGFPCHNTSADMSIEIKIRKNEPIDRALRRMKKKLDRENIIKGVRAKRYFEKPCERRRRKEKVQAFTQMLRRRYAE